jgi:hypothetical protein
MLPPSLDQQSSAIAVKADPCHIDETRGAIFKGMDDGCLVHASSCSTRDTWKQWKLKILYSGGMAAAGTWFERVKQSEAAGNL